MSAHQWELSADECFDWSNDMGLDLIELVMDVEDAFGIEISDEDANKMRTVGDLESCVLRQACMDSSAFCGTSRSFHLLRRKLLDIFPLARTDVRPAVSMEALLPCADRRAIWRRLRDHDIMLPPLMLGRAAFSVTAVVVAVLTGTMAVLASINSAAVLLALQIPLAYVLTRPLAVRIPFGCQTLGDAALWIMPIKGGGESPGSVSRDEITRRVRLIVAYQLDLPPETIRSDSRFVEDLCAD